jgi:hypothetical protein
VRVCTRVRAYMFIYVACCMFARVCDSSCFRHDIDFVHVGYFYRSNPVNSGAFIIDALKHSSYCTMFDSKSKTSTSAFVPKLVRYCHFVWCYIANLAA